MSEIVNGVGINNAHAHVPKNHSKFPLKEVFMDTHRFGEYHPHFCAYVWESEKHPVRCVADTRSYTLKAPLMQDIVMNKDYGLVNMRAILPLQAERVRTNPTIGDDVPADAYTSVSDFVNKVKDFIATFDTAIASYNPSGTADLLKFNTWVFKKLILTESIFSRGSLLASLGCNLSSCLLVSPTISGTTYNYSIDEVFDLLVADFASYLATNGPCMVNIDGTVYYVALPSQFNPQIATLLSPTRDTLLLRDFLQKIRDTSNWYFTDLTGADYTFLAKYITGSNVTFRYNTAAEFPIDLARPWAYHLYCAEFFTNDKVDYIYSAELFRQYIGSLFGEFAINSGYGQKVETFSWNGVDLPYDYLSAHIFDQLIASDVPSLISDVTDVPTLQYFLTLFGYRRSLRFKDYFTGSRTRPLALVGNSASGVSTDVPVVNGYVSVIDTTRSIQAQRFLNAVNAGGRKFGEWINTFFGVTPNKDMHEPIFLAHSSDSIFAADNENTGDAVYQDTNGQNTMQNSVTAVFRGRSNDFEYTVEVKEPAIIIGVTSYDIERVYPDTIHRDFFIRDRYDMFNPMMQYIGDQPVYVHEIVAGTDKVFGTTFGYQFRDMQWKQSYPRCAGAFGSDKLPGYAFVYHRNGRASVVSPDFIRSKNCELDEFYLSLTCYSLGTYFHFIMRQVNVDNAIRPMIAQPQIL